MRVLELFCGIGGCAAALDGRAQVVSAIDINRAALSVYAGNFDHPILVRTIESISREIWQRFEAALWWMSPPCQPFTRRGNRRDLADPRTRPLLQVLSHVADDRPTYVGLENVPEFAGSATHTHTCDVLRRAGYQIQEQLLCPTELGIPNRRRRYYLLAGQEPLLPPRPPATPRRQLRDYLDVAPAEELFVTAAVLSRYAPALHIVDADDADGVAACFTSAYGRSPVFSGSYLATPAGIRRFSPSEIVRLLGFPDWFCLPAAIVARRAWPLVGNSVSVPCVQYVLSAIPDLAQPRAADVC